MYIQGDSQTALDLSLEALNMRKACLLATTKRPPNGAGAKPPMEKENELVPAGDAPELELVQDLLQSMQVWSATYTIGSTVA